MNYLDKLAQAKRLANVEGVVLYVTDKGRIRTVLSKGEKQEYKIEMKNNKQYVFDSKEKQIQPKRKPSKKGTPKLSDTSDAPMD